MKLLQVEKLDEKRLFEEYERRSWELFRNGQRQENLELWLEAHRKMPNNIEVKEMLMSGYYDMDKVNYRNEILELGMEIYNSDAGSYYKAQAISEIVGTYFECGQIDLAGKWADKSYSIHSAQEILYARIDDGEDLMADVRFCAYWFFQNLFYMTMRINESEKVPVDCRYKREMLKTLVKLFETLYPNGDMTFELLESMRILHILIAEREIELGADGDAVRRRLESALWYAEKSMNVKEHDPSHPFLYGWHILASPDDNRQWVRNLKNDLAESRYDVYRSTDWFCAIEKRVDTLLRDE